MARGYRQCKEIRSNGTRCKGNRLADSDLCWSHKHLDQARESALRNSPFVERVATR